MNKGVGLVILLVRTKRYRANLVHILWILQGNEDYDGGLLTTVIPSQQLQTRKRPRQKFRELDH